MLMNNTSVKNTSSLSRLVCQEGRNASKNRRTLNVCRLNFIAICAGEPKAFSLMIGKQLLKQLHDERSTVG